MKNLLTFIDANTYDERLAWRIPHEFSETIFDIEWIRDEKLRWRFKDGASLFWTQVPQKQLIEALAREGADLQEFEQRLSRTIMHQIVCSHTVYANGVDLFGPDQVEKAISETKRFAKELEDLLLAATETNAKRKELDELEHLPGDQRERLPRESHSAIKPGLRIIK